MYDTLNPEQLAAVRHIDGPLLALAGAGTGKTKMLVTRIAHMLESGALPRQIMAVTFTNKAAQEMKERLENLAGGRSLNVRMGTFHSLCAGFLRRHADAVGLTPNFTVLDAGDCLRAARQTLEDMGVDEKKWPAKQFAVLVSRIKDKGLLPGQIAGLEDSGFADGRMDALYAEYRRRLLASNSVDFGDLLLHCLTLFTEHPDILAAYHREIRYLLVDEYQDTNVVQYLWLRLLAQKHRNICCVGDDDQSIYGWRGAEVGNILRFDKDYPDAHVVRLERNYRSTASILHAASTLISYNQNRLGKTLRTEGEKGEKLRVALLWDDREEARFIADEIESLRLSGLPLQEAAVLVRAGAQTRAVEECFMERGLAYRVVGGTRFYERQEIRDAVAYLRLVTQEADDFAFERVVNLPKRGVGAASLRSVRLYARDRGVSCMQAIREHLKSPCLDLRGGVAKTLEEFAGQLGRWRELMESGAPLSELAETALRESGYLAMWKQEATQDAQERADNLRELFRALDRFESLTAFLEHVGLVADGDGEADGGGQVAVMTLHAAKGLEFRAVFLPGWEEELFPSRRSVDEQGGAGLEEERRLAYVGITRARERVYITHTANRLYYGQIRQNLPSRFIDELPAEAVEKVNMVQGAYGFPGGQSRSSGKAYYKEEEPERKREIRASALGFRIGERVLHKSFGYGTVLSLEGDRIDVFFDKAGQKKMVDRFVEKAG
jgi:DNA helicase-2/ATP-dependent DNA helicase PcrA